MRTGLILLCGFLLTPGLLAQPTPDALFLSLGDAIHLAQDRSPSAKTAREEFNRQYWRYQAFQASYYPSLAMTASVPGFVRAISAVPQNDGTVRFLPQSLSQSSMGLEATQIIPWTGGRITFGSGLEHLQLFDVSNQQALPWSASPFYLRYVQPIFQFNPQRWNEKIEDLRFEQSRQQYAESTSRIAVDVSRIFFNAYLAQINLEIATYNAAVNDTIFTISRGRFNVGNIAENDLLQAELAQLRAQVRLEDARLEAERSLQELKTELGLPAGRQIELVYPQSVPVFDVNPQLAVEKALENQSAMTGLELDRLNAERDFAQAKSRNRVSTNLIGRIGFNKSAESFTGLYDQPRDQQSFNLTIEIPIFQWGEGKAEIEQAAANLNRAEVTSRLETEQLKQEVYFLARELILLKNQVYIAAKADTVATRRFEVTKNRYLIGNVDITILQNAQNEKDAARRSYVSTLQNFWTTYYQLRRMTHYDFQHNQPLKFSPPRP